MLLAFSVALAVGANLEITEMFCDLWLVVIALPLSLAACLVAPTLASTPKSMPLLALVAATPLHHSFLGRLGVGACREHHNFVAAFHAEVFLQEPRPQFGVFVGNPAQGSLCP